MKSKIYRDPTLGILFVGKRQSKGFQIHQKDEISKIIRPYSDEYYYFKETAQQALNMLAHDKNLEEIRD